MISTFLHLSSSVLIDISGDYLFYSYDHNYIFGRGNIIIKAGNCEFQGTSLEINMRNRSLLLTSSCKVTCSDKKIQYADMVRSDLNKMSVILYNYGEKIEITSLKGTKPSSDFSRKRRILLEDSLLYFVGKRFRIKDNFELTGYEVIVFIEGTQSVSFNKFRMDKGVSGKNDLFSINNLWYANKTGLITDVSFSYKNDTGKTKFSNREFVKLNYDLFKVRSDSPKPQFNIGTESSLKFAKASTLILRGGYITGNSGTALLTWNFKPGKIVNSSLTLDYRDRLRSNSELWIRGGLGIDMKKGGQLNFKYNHAKNLGYSGDISYSNRIAKSLSFSAASSLSAIKVSDSILNKISDTRLSLNYTNRIFNFSANYSLNNDLINDNARYSPGFAINTKPIHFYGGLLNLNFSSALLFNTIRREGSMENSFRSNSALSISGKHLDISDNIFIDISGRIEQFVDSDPMENFTTAGVILRSVNNFSDYTSIELLYNFHTRRETREWLITGTSTGNLSALFRIKTPGGKLNMQSSISYDIERGDYTSGFLNLRYNLIKHWDLQSFINYDFEFKRMNYSVFLERRAGRILLRVSYRSLSKQFQLELIPR